MVMRGLKRFVVYANGIEVGWFFDKKKACSYAQRYKQEVSEQDEAFHPEMTIKEEILYELQ